MFLSDLTALASVNTCRCQQHHRFTSYQNYRHTAHGNAHNTLGHKVLRQQVSNTPRHPKIARSFYLESASQQRVTVTVTMTVTVTVTVTVTRPFLTGYMTTQAPDTG